MSESELISACLKNDKTAKRQFFEFYFPTLSYIALRYSKNKQQSENAAMTCFSLMFNNLSSFKNQSKFTEKEFVKNQFITHLVAYIKSIRNEYYVASTIRAIENTDHSYDLFKDSKFVDVRNAGQESVLKAIQELVPSQRLIFNLHIVDGYSLIQMSEILETSEQTIKSNLEKARYNLQKTIEYNLKFSNNEQPV